MWLNKSHVRELTVKGLMTAFPGMTKKGVCLVLREDMVRKAVKPAGEKL